METNTFDDIYNYIEDIFMNRSHYFNYIEEKLNSLSYRIDSRGKTNLLELHIHSETFFAGMLNMLFEYQLKNANAIKQNIEAIDLIDENKKIIAQISATCKKGKIQSALNKIKSESYEGFRFKFISISKDAEKMRKLTFTNPHSILFSPKDDIIDIKTILNKLLHEPIDKQKQFYEFIKKELACDIDIVKFDSNITTMIDILSNENLKDGIESPEINAFAISKKIKFNNLTPIKDTIDNYKIYYNKLNEKYVEYDKQGMNKSLSVLEAITRTYRNLPTTGKEEKDLFFDTVSGVRDLIVNSKNYNEIPLEELDLCVDILVVDAFVRCKIFKNPEGYTYVIT